jgi:hypothetical protein
LEMGPQELFAQAGLNPRFSQSQPPKQLELQTWAPVQGRTCYPLRCCYFFSSMHPSGHGAVFHRVCGLHFPGG